MKQSAGILLYKFIDRRLYFLLVHPGGPFWKNKDLESWSIPKGEFAADEDPFNAALREFEEETGLRITGAFSSLMPVRIKSGKVIYSWALEHDFDVDSLKSNEFEMEWPPKSGHKIMVPEVDRAEWFSVDEAMLKISQGQKDLLTQVVAMTALKS